MELVVPTFNCQASTLSSAPKTPQFVDEALQLVNFTVSHCSSLYLMAAFLMGGRSELGREKFIFSRKTVYLTVANKVKGNTE